MRGSKSLGGRTISRLVGCILLPVALSACGGGGGGGERVVVVTATPGPTLSPTPTVPITLTATALPPSPTPTATEAPASATPTLSPSPLPSSTPIPPLTATPTATLEPSATLSPTATPLTGAIVTAFEVADASGQFNNPIGTDAFGRKIFSRTAGNGFILFVEGRPGPSLLPVGTEVFSPKADDPTAQPDLQLLTARPLGDGSLAVCDNSFPVLGGIPGSTPSDYTPVQPITDALNDFGCRFTVYSETDFACTQDSTGNFVFRSPSSTVQFCTLLTDALTFPGGDTILSARLRDTAGNAGPSVEIVVRVPQS
ncbi:MAG TPA: hypothetical protein VMT89_16040 [Candidatus Acidoferrales bacterium]|nr:hypothetical protein [Candidatus Acidoferrales bacterium]